jgi:hypothetical protein
MSHCAHLYAAFYGPNFFLEFCFENESKHTAGLLSIQCVFGIPEETLFIFIVTSINAYIQFLQATYYIRVYLYYGILCLS